MTLPALPPGDRILLATVDAACADAVRRAGDRLACRIGCIGCCIGGFPIPALDAARLAAGLAALEKTIRAGHARSWSAPTMPPRSWGPAFPGEAESGRLAEREEMRDAFLAAHASLPCPALEPDTGRCELYAHRPIACRTFGPPMRIEGDDLPPCRLASSARLRRRSTRLGAGSTATRRGAAGARRRARGGRLGDPHRLRVGAVRRPTRPSESSSRP